MTDVDPENRENRIEAQLGVIAEVVEIARRLGVEVWLRGGWAMDFALGTVSRRHVDVDWFAWRDDLPLLVETLCDRGWTELAQHPLEQQRDLVREDVEMGFAPLARRPDGAVVVGGGPREGEEWPAGILENAVIAEVEGIRARAISVAAQIAIKQMMPVWRPDLALREKDRRDVELLRSHADRDET